MHTVTLALALVLYIPHPVSGEGIAGPHGGKVRHIVLGVPDGSYRVVSGADSLEVQSVGWSMRFQSWVVNPTEIVRGDR